MTSVWGFALHSYFQMHHWCDILSHPGTATRWQWLHSLLINHGGASHFQEINKHWCFSLQTQKTLFLCCVKPETLHTDAVNNPLQTEDIRPRAWWTVPWISDTSVSVFQSLLEWVWSALSLSLCVSAGSCVDWPTPQVTVCRTLRWRCVCATVCRSTGPCLPKPSRLWWASLSNCVMSHWNSVEWHCKLSVCVSSRRTSLACSRHTGPSPEERGSPFTAAIWTQAAPSPSRSDSTPAASRGALICSSHLNVHSDTIYCYSNQSTPLHFQN